MNMHWSFQKDKINLHSKGQWFQSIYLERTVRTLKNMAYRKVEIIIIIIIIITII